MAEIPKSASQFAAAVGVILSLLFVGMEVRQNTVAVRGATIQAISDQASQFTLTMAQDENWPRIVSFLIAGGSYLELGPEDKVRFRYGAMTSVRFMENRYRQVQLGVLEPEELSVSGGAGNSSWYRSHYFLEYWQSYDQTTVWSPEFVDFMETSVLGLR